jgi:hypothetical protein
MYFVKVEKKYVNEFIYLNKVEINRFLLLYVDNREFKLIKLLVKDNF